MAEKYEVTFQFEKCTPTVTIEAETEEGAIQAARIREYPPVGDGITAVAVRVNRGGTRRGAGNKTGSKRVSEPRNVRKYIRWTDREWETIAERAKAFGMSTTAYQRAMILKEGKGA